MTALGPGEVIFDHQDGVGAPLGVAAACIGSVDDRAAATISAEAAELRVAFRVVGAGEGVILVRFTDLKLVGLV